VLLLRGKHVSYFLLALLADCSVHAEMCVKDARSMVKVTMEAIRRGGPARNIAKVHQRLRYVWHGRAQHSYEQATLFALVHFVSGAQQERGAVCGAEADSIKQCLKQLPTSLQCYICPAHSCQAVHATASTGTTHHQRGHADVQSHASGMRTGVLSPRTTPLRPTGQLSLSAPACWASR